ncbi:anti-sigma factor family protein, partial [Rugamonas aquatica]
MNPPVTEAELQAWVDGRLPPARRDAVDAHLAQHPADMARLQAYRSQNAALHALFDPLLAQPVPPAIAASVSASASASATAPSSAPAAGRHRPAAWPPMLRAAAMLALTL